MDLCRPFGPVTRRIVLVCILFALAVPVRAQLATFEEYAAMSIENRSKVRANAWGIIYKNALQKGDTAQAGCLRNSYLIEYAGHDKAALAHARLRGVLDGGIEIRDDDSRVEYAIAHHLAEVCPPGTQARSH